MKPTKYSVAVVIKNQQNELLIVKRPDEDSPVAGIWGLPAITLLPGESELQAARRIGPEKLGVQLKPGEKIGERVADHGEYILHLSDYAAEITDGGQPSVPQPDTSVTQYTALRYTSNPAALIPITKKERSLFADLSAIIRYTLGTHV